MPFITNLIIKHFWIKLHFWHYLELNLESYDYFILGITIEDTYFKFQFFVTIFKIICLLIAIAYYTLAERKIMAAIQRRCGPNVVGFLGLLQPIADGLKLLTKEILIPKRVNKLIFIFAPIIILSLSLLAWSVIPFGLSEPGYLISKIPQNAPFKFGLSYPVDIWCWAFQDWMFIKDNNLGYWLPRLRVLCYGFFGVLWSPEFLFPIRSQKIYNADFLSLIEYKTGKNWASENNFNSKDWQWIWEWSNLADVRLTLLFIFALSSLNVYGIICAGWASNSKYAFLGSLRSAAQMISYEVSMGLSLLPVVLLSGSFNFAEIVDAQVKTVWFFLPLLPCTVIFFISLLAETNRAPFDLVEAEAELVAGYNVEYSSIIFAMFFLAEYSNMMLMSAIATILFFGGWDAPISFLASNLPFWFCIKTVSICFGIVLARASFPRYRYDQLMNIGWTVFLPISFSYLIFLTGLLSFFDALPRRS